MIKIYKTNESNMIERVDEVIDNCWIDLVSPTKEEIEVVLSFKLIFSISILYSVISSPFNTVRIFALPSFTSPFLATSYNLLLSISLV